MTHILAAINDIATIQLEATSSGMRYLLEEERKKREKKVAQASGTVWEYERQISEDPLPVWWVTGKGSTALAPEGHLSMREKFSREIRVLKRMGFEDETVIITALKETAGNVSQAAKLLMRNVSSKCA
jgi:hypothetical protein